MRHSSRVKVFSEDVMFTHQPACPYVSEKVLRAGESLDASELNELRAPSNLDRAALLRLNRPPLSEREPSVPPPEVVRATVPRGACGYTDPLKTPRERVSAGPKGAQPDNTQALPRGAGEYAGLFQTSGRL